MLDDDKTGWDDFWQILLYVIRILAPYFLAIAIALIVMHWFSAGPDQIVNDPPTEIPAQR